MLDMQHLFVIKQLLHHSQNIPIYLSSPSPHIALGNRISAEKYTTNATSSSLLLLLLFHVHSVSFFMIIANYVSIYIVLCNCKFFLCALSKNTNQSQQMHLFYHSPLHKNISNYKFQNESNLLLKVFNSFMSCANLLFSSFPRNNLLVVLI